MLISASTTFGYILRGIDDDIGEVKDFLFDDRLWTIRYMVADTNKWLPASRKVLVSPISLGEPDFKHSAFPVALSRDQIKKSPPLESDLPVSRHYEVSLFKYYGYGYYWMGPDVWGMNADPIALAKQQLIIDDDEDMDNIDPCLRSVKEVNGYSVSAKDTSIGHVTDFILDEKQWKIAFLVINTRNWWPGGRNVLISPDNITSVSWDERSVSVDLTTEEIKVGPEFNNDAFSDPDFEEVMHGSYVQ